MELIQDALCEQIVSAAERLAQGKDPGKLTVRDILKEMGITNRVFYNRFHSIEEVLSILYARSVSAVRKSLSSLGTEQPASKTMCAPWRSGPWN